MGNYIEASVVVYTSRRSCGDRESQSIMTDSGRSSTLRLQAEKATILATNRWSQHKGKSIGALIASSSPPIYDISHGPPTGFPPRVFPRCPFLFFKDGNHTWPCDYPRKRHSVVLLSLCQLYLLYHSMVGRSLVHHAMPRLVA